jgi:hypothetical protein
MRDNFKPVGPQPQSLSISLVGLARRDFVGVVLFDPFAKLLRFAFLIFLPCVVFGLRTTACTWATRACLP